jgi:hypothetical protein
MRQNKDLEQNIGSERTHFAPEHFQAWWNTKRLRKMRQNKDLEQNTDSEKTHFALRPISRMPAAIAEYLPFC